MRTLIVDETQLASILFAKNIMLPWRSQKDLIIYVPFSAWKKFVKNFKNIPIQRNPVNYNLLCRVEKPNVWVVNFLQDIAISMYNEVSVSANHDKDATIILPYFEDGDNRFIGDVIKDCNSLTAGELVKACTILTQSSPKIRQVFRPTSHNQIVLNLAYYIAHTSITDIQKFNITLEV